MDFDSSSKFIASLARFLQSLCNGYVEFDKGVEVIGHIYLSVDSDTGRKIDYVLNEKVCKNDNSVTFISNSFHAQPAEKPKPTQKDSENKNGDSSPTDESEQLQPHSTNVGTTGLSQDSSSNKRPRSPAQRRHSMGQGSGGPAAKSPRYHAASRSSNSDIPSMNNSMSNDYDDGSYQGDEDSQNYPSNFLNQDYSGTDVDQKPVIDPDISIVKEEYLASQQQQATASYSNTSHTSGPGRGRGSSSSQPSPYSNVPQSSNYSSGGDYSSSIEPRDPSELTPAQREELEMYYRKGTDQHLTFLRNMREAHAMYPFTGKRDKELFDKALAELFLRLPVLLYQRQRTKETFYINATRKMQKRKLRSLSNISGQFKSPGMGRGGRGGYGRQPSYPGTPQHYSSYSGYSGRSPMPMSPMQMSQRGADGSEGYYQDSGEMYDYQQGASDDSRDTMQSAGGDLSQQPMGFSGEFGGDSNQQGSDQDPNLMQDKKLVTDPGGAISASGHASIGENPDGVKSPPDIKYEVTPMNFIKPDDFELIEIDEEEEM